MSYSTLFIDLDDTLYPADSGVWMAIRQRIDLYVMDKFRLSLEDARVRRQELFIRYGTTMRGLQAEYQVNEDEYLAFVHDVPLTQFLYPNPGLCQMLQAYPQRRVIFTNADANHARRVLAVLGLSACFQQIIDIKAMSPYCKPMQEAFRIALEKTGEPDPARCVLVDDQAHNVQAARAFGLHAIRVGPLEPGFESATISRLDDLPKVLPPDGAGL
jgi:putative hydrolase of the HAD superfamily